MQKLAAALHSEEVRQFIEEKYKGAVVPALLSLTAQPASETPPRRGFSFSPVSLVGFSPLQAAAPISSLSAASASRAGPLPPHVPAQAGRSTARKSCVAPGELGDAPVQILPDVLELMGPARRCPGILLVAEDDDVDQGHGIDVRVAQQGVAGIQHHLSPTRYRALSSTARSKYGSSCERMCSGIGSTPPATRRSRDCWIQFCRASVAIRCTRS